MKIPSVFTVVIEKDQDTGMYVGEVPGIPGCHSQGETIEKLMGNMREVLQLCLEEEKSQIPKLPKFIGTQQIELEA